MPFKNSRPESASFALVETECLFVKVLEQMKWLNAYISNSLKVGRAITNIDDNRCRIRPKCVVTLSIGSSHCGLEDYI